MVGGRGDQAETAMQVFLSVGRTATPEQEGFVRAIEAYLRSNGFEPMTAGRTSFSSRQPLLHVRELMEQCAGAVVIAFERTHIEKAMELRGSSEEKPVSNTNLPTVWNQIEAGMAYVHDHPLLVIVQRGLKSEGLLEKGYDWYVQWVNLDLAELGTPQFQGVFSDWKKRVCERSQRPTALQQVKPVELTLGRIFASLTIPQLWGLATAAATLLAAIAALAFKLGSISGSGS